jgi:hypothetical protein
MLLLITTASISHVSVPEDELTAALRANFSHESSPKEAFNCASRPLAASS